ncbi:MAG TPA: glycosyltransferase family 2 protein [Microvirga sp.]|jgi:glycosyltransferase involved in cell wall biosynthesis
MTMRTAAIIPCYKVSAHIVGVVRELIGRVDAIFVVDDCCPERSGQLVEAAFAGEPAVTVLHHEVNQGVGGAVATGYRVALKQGYDIMVKLDGDGQMDPGYLQAIIAPIVQERADYTKGNRFHALEYLQSMPPLRIFGNSALSFVNKVSSGYWNVMDPTNGYTAIHATALKRIDLDKVARRYFFESDMLFRLSIIRAVVRDIPTPAVYGDEKSNLKISRVLLDFPRRYAANFFKRFFYNYLLRDLNPASIETVLGTVLVVFSLTTGIYHWVQAGLTGEATPTGTIMLVTLPAILGVQFLLAALNFDISNTPKEPLQTISTLQVDPQPLRTESSARDVDQRRRALAIVNEKRLPGSQV